jgi:predicted membrane GTPase involved in stress response
MKRVLNCLTLLIIVLMLSACSSIDDFVVINRSDVPVEIVYTFTRTESGEIHVKQPRIMDATNLKNTDRPWEEIPREQYVLDAKTGTVAVRLAPGKALLLNRATNYREDSEYADTSFGISTLNLTGARGSIRLEGRQARMLFRYEEKCHVLIYE